MTAPRVRQAHPDWTGTRGTSILTLSKPPFPPGNSIEDSPDPLLQFHMFFYRDAQFHRIGVSTSTFFPFLSYLRLGSKLPLHGLILFIPQLRRALRVGVNHAKNPQYTPNGFVNKSRPDTADNTVSREPNFYHEGKASDYHQPRVLCQKVMTSKARENLHLNTARVLNCTGLIRSMRNAVYDLLPEKKFDMLEVQEASKNAEMAGKSQKFRHSANTDVSMGTVPSVPIYNV
ncbi:hypothetical protein TSTA_085390 [Talaromyces stipitatus ATCC 10500]|uniref:Uncharacterized protein n=1 Tax=Talaromyces stipitatus (strain ATCC 10500 / CBS 375.48 / QM 6759 / NRRL 1006) TaxID=441959 RepID=B8M0L1_TALSN|nr:uncharacterized protein TSTA_085390 [Talaromyces stipitatus ATCC 10500]EED21308.1 hypothetical protein TSTA_085390 [Talaromyces stipitatus ATCC 10500]